jgi:hypothetical protein
MPVPVPMPMPVPGLSSGLLRAALVSRLTLSSLYYQRTTLA